MGTVKYTGPVASFHCPTNAEIRSLKVHFSPKQEGTGDPSPENVRPIVGWDGVELTHIRKNLFNKDTVTINYRYNGDADLIYNKESCVSDYITIKPNTNYILANAGNLLVNQRCAWFDSNKEVIGAATAYYSIKTSPSNAAYVRITVNKNYVDIAQFYEEIDDKKINYEFGVLGKNKFDKSQYTDGRIMKSNGSNYTGESGYYISPFIPVTVGVSYTKNSPTIDAYHRFATYSSDNVNTFIRIFDTSNTITIEPGENYIRFCGETSEIDTAQLELGSTTTAYEPYDPNHTVYGGWVDLISGEIQEEYSNIQLTSDIFLNKTAYDNSDMYSFNIYGLYGGPYNNGYDMPNILVTNYKVDAIQQIMSNNFPPLTASLTNSGNRIKFFTYSNQFETIENFISSMKEETILIELKNPLIYHLSPTQLQTFLGHNNVWSNADYVEIEYDLHETQSILARKQFIMAHQPHIETAASSFTTDLRAPLKSAKIYFNPIQEGSGDPSPDNVRPITGWTGLSLYHSGENLYVPNLDNKGYISSSGVINVDTTSTYTDLIPVTVGDTYSFRCTTVSVNGNTHRRIHGYNSSGTWVQQLGGGQTGANTVENFKATVTIPSGISYIRVSFRNEDTNVRVAKENVYEVDWSNEGTLYGGYVDLVTGKVWNTWWQNHKEITTTDGSIDNNGYRRIAWNLASAHKCNWDLRSQAVCNIASYGNNSTNHFNLSTVSAYLYLSGDDTNAYSVDIYYPSQTPYIITTLTPAQLKTFKGSNTFWTNSNGNISIDYYTH